MKNKWYSRWWGPAVGLGIGLEIGINGFRFVHTSPTIFIISSAILGLFTGCLMLLADPPGRKPDELSVNRPNSTEVSGRPDSSQLMGRLFSILSLFLLIVPPLGLAVSITALIGLRKQPGWHRILAWITFGISLTICSLLVAIELLIRFFPPLQQH